MDFKFSDPYAWLDDQIRSATQQGDVEPTAMTLATVDENASPDARVVLFKGFYNGGLTFYTNYESAKARQLGLNPRVTAVFYWPRLFQQTRVWGQVHKLPRAVSEAYFASRPRLSQLGAWASKQSARLASLADLQKVLQEMEQRFPDQVPCPSNWGGYALRPWRWEFWIGKPGRLHERYVFELKPDVCRDGENTIPPRYWDRYLLFP